MDNKKYFRFSDMGVQDSGQSMELSFADWERVINILLEESYDPVGSYDVLLSQPQSFTKSYIDEKSNYFSNLLSTIMETKNNFLQSCSDISRNIEEMTKQIMRCVKAHEKKLKAELQEIKAEKMAKWEHQVAVCEEALKGLQKSQIAPFGKKDCLTYYETLAKELEHVDSGDVNFDLHNYTELLKSVQNMGKIIHMVSSDAYSNDVKSIIPKFTFGRGGDKPGEFCRAWGICSDPTGRILVCDRSNHRIQIFNEQGQFLIQFGREGSQPGEFNRPTGIDIDKKCRILVADKDNHRIQVFSFSGSYLFAFGSQGSEAGQFLYPWDVASNKNCDIAVSDSKNHRVQLFNENGIVIAVFDARRMGIRNPRTALRCLDSPRGIAFRPDGTLLVTDFNNHKVLLLSTTFKEITSLGCEGMKPGQFFRPQGIACDKLGRFAVADSKNYRIQVFDADGTLLKSFGKQGDEPGQFDCPQGISFHRNQNILVVDLSNNRVQVF